MKISARLATPADTEKFLQYEAATADNLFDPEAGLHKSSLTFCTENEQGEQLVFLPTQLVVVLESLGISDKASKREVAVSLRKLMDEIVDKARSTGIGEIAFVCKEESTEKFAVKHGFERLPWNLYRLKVKNYKN